jgi:hypothetical protein
MLFVGLNVTLTPVSVTTVQNRFAPDASLDGPGKPAFLPIITAALHAWLSRGTVAALDDGQKTPFFQSLLSLSL